MFQSFGKHFSTVACLWTLYSSYWQTERCSDFGWVYNVAYTHTPVLCAILISLRVLILDLVATHLSVAFLHNRHTKD